jgi:hypothetical protein
LRPVPSAAIWIDLRIGCFRQRSVDNAALLQPSCPIHSRANQWMTENHSGTKLQPAFRFDGFRNRLRNSQLAGSAPNECSVADWIGSRDEQQPSRIAGKPGEPAREALLDARGQWHRRR